jgi:hypothetical protein
MDSANERYRAAAHAMQSGVKLKMTREGVGDPDEGYVPRGECSPKHLRVGINSAMSDHGALARLLIDKGVFTEEEYTEAIADGMEREVQFYRTELNLPDNVHLG